ncbi:MAG: PRC-barrel domain-containing protein [Roseivivax sp.]|nr:PRC-barrel domain-containing protein [Roseivivax sp.]
MTIRNLLISAAATALLAGSVQAQSTEGTQTQPQAVAPMAGTGLIYNKDTFDAQLEAMTVSDVLGLVVESPNGSNIGEIDYLLRGGSDGIDAVIGIGGFLGLGEYTVSVPLSEFSYNAEKNVLVLNTTEEALKQQPEFDETGVESLPGDMVIGDIVSAAPVAPMPQTAPAADQSASVDTTAPAMPKAEGHSDMTASANTSATMPAEGDGKMETADAGTAATMPQTGTGTTMAQTAPVLSEPSEHQQRAQVALAQMTVGDLLGTNVQDAKGEVIGEIDYIIAPATGPEAVIGIGGFLGLGEYTVALPLSAFEMIDGGDAFIVDMTEEQLKAMPEFDEAGVQGLDDDVVLSQYFAAES